MFSLYVFFSFFTSIFFFFQWLYLSVHNFPFKQPTTILHSASFTLTPPKKNMEILGEHGKTFFFCNILTSLPHKNRKKNTTSPETN